MKKSNATMLKEVGLWVLSVPVALAFIFFGGQMLAGSPQMAMGFQHFGYPVWLMYVVGAIEVTGAVLVVLPMFASYGAMVLSVVMLGAIVSHVSMGEYPALWMPLIFLAASAAIAWGRWQRRILPSFLHGRAPA